MNNLVKKLAVPLVTLLAAASVPTPSSETPTHKNPNATQVLPYREPLFHKNIHPITSQRTNHTLSSETIEELIQNAYIKEMIQQGSHKEREVITPEFIYALIEVESEKNPNALSSAGAKGLGQIMPLTWKEVMGNVPYEMAFDPQQNVTATTRIAKDLYRDMQQHNSNWEYMQITQKREHILAAYNGGKTRFRKNDFTIDQMPRETRTYLQKFKKKKII